MGCFKDGNTGVVVDVGSWCDTDAADLSSECVGDIVAIEVHGRQDTVFGRAGDDLLEHCIGDNILDENRVSSDWIGHGAPRTSVKFGCSKFFLCKGVAPVSETTLGEFHDVAFVNDGNAWFVVVDGVLNCCTHDAGGSFAGNGLDTDTRGVGKSNLVNAHFVLEEINDFLDIVAA